jgi:hypothetical protein
MVFNRIQLFLLGLSSLVHASRASMSFTHNFHQPPVFYINGIKYINDYDLDEYRPQVQAFLTRRRTTKREIRMFPL